ncbi:MAG: enolase C-terminal domain-like protein [Thermoplasmata archaeon]|nr:mandelate racemase/muconate lactonizing enzyme family protein [Thermoplasmata archaeon]
MTKIKNIEIFELGEKITNTPWSSTILILRLTTEDGYVGYGEAPTTLMTLPVLEEMNEVARIFNGKDPTEIEKNVREFYKHSFYLPVSMESTAALSAFEIASLDITGKIYSIPIYKMLGGKVRDKIKAYANGWYSDCINPDDFLQKAKKMEKIGYKAIKFDPFGNQFDSLDHDHLKNAIEIVSTLKNETGLELLIEYHGRFNASSAIIAGKSLEKFDPLFMEEPVHPDSIESLMKFRKSVNTRIALGERVLNKNLFLPYLKNDLVDIIQPDVTNIGGIFETKKAAVLSDAFGVDVAIHNAFGPIQTAASLQLDVNINNFLIQESFENSWPEWKINLIKDGYEIEDGLYKISSKPGLGIEINEKILDEFKIQGMEFLDPNEPPWVVKGTFR